MLNTRKLWAVTESCICWILQHHRPLTQTLMCGCSAWLSRRRRLSLFVKWLSEQHYLCVAVWPLLAAHQKHHHHIIQSVFCHLALKTTVIVSSGMEGFQCDNHSLGDKKVRSHTSRPLHCRGKPWESTDDNVVSILTKASMLARSQLRGDTLRPSGNPPNMRPLALPRLRLK